MNLEEIKKIIQTAHNAAKDEKDGSYEMEVFRIVLTKLLEEQLANSIHPSFQRNIPQTGTPQTGTPQTGTPQTGTPQTGTTLQMKLQDLSTKCGISTDELNNVISIKGDKIVILPTSFEGSERLRLINAAQCVLICYEIIFGKEWTQSREILECLGGIGVFDPNGHFAQYLKSEREIFIKNPNSHEYKLTVPKGRNSAYEIVKKLAKGEVVK